MKLVSLFRDALNREPPMPPLAPGVILRVSGAEPHISAEEGDGALEPISGFLCVIEYGDDVRLISCRRYDIKNDVGYVGAICQQAKGYRQFRADRITAVIDAATGEILGRGDYFNRFAATVKSPFFGLTRSRRTLLMAGLNALAFLARCDGRWHPLESEPIERFVTGLWLRKEWEGDPPIDDILAHAQRLAPDAHTAMKGLGYYARSRNSTALLMRAANELIAADGVICDTETAWIMEVEAILTDLAGMKLDIYTSDVEELPN